PGRARTPVAPSAGTASPSPAPPTPGRSSGAGAAGRPGRTPRPTCRTRSLRRSRRRSGEPSTSTASRRTPRELVPALPRDDHVPGPREPVEDEPLARLMRGEHLLRAIRPLGERLTDDLLGAARLVHLGVARPVRLVQDAHVGPSRPSKPRAVCSSAGALSCVYLQMVSPWAGIVKGYPPGRVAQVGQHIAIYVRISRDRSGRAENVDTQERHCRAYVDRMKQTGEWPDLPVEVYSDNDLTAADPGTYRPDYARLLHDIRAGRVAQLVSADQDRLTRQPSEWEELMPVLVAADITETHGYRDGVTPVELGKRAYGRFKALMGAEYVEGIKVKVYEKLDALAAQGRPGGGHAFGYRRTTNEKGERALEVVPELAEHVRWAASKALAGWSATAIARELDARDVPTVHG